MFRAILVALTLLCSLPLAARDLEIYWIDVEGGGATLIVNPSGQSLLVDTGNPGPNDRDPNRVVAVAKLAGLKKIDYLLTTHYHGDHVGGTPAVARMIPVGQFFDHGDSIEAQGRGAPLWDAYKTVSAGKRTIVKPGMKLPLKDVDATIVVSNAEVIPSAINRGALNPYCMTATPKPADTTENQRSAGFLLTYGKFKFVDLGDLTWDMEMQLACPINKLGTVTLFQATHHGFFNDFSGAPAHVLALKPQVVVVNNGPTKGWQNSAWDTAQKIEGLEDVWQIHQAMGPNRDHNVAADLIANPEPTDQCKGNWIKATIAKNGTFTLTNGRNGFKKSYTAR